MLSLAIFSALTSHQVGVFGIGSEWQGILRLDEKESSPMNPTLTTSPTQAQAAQPSLVALVLLGIDAALAWLPDDLGGEPVIP